MVKLSELKRWCIHALIGCLVLSAAVAVLTILSGEFGEIYQRTIVTLLVAIAHTMICLVFIWDDNRQNTFERLAIFINTIFVLLVLSFLVSIFTVWEIITPESLGRFYQIAFVVGFASLHCDILSKILNKERYIDLIIRANYLFIAVVTTMLAIIIMTTDGWAVLPPLYYRTLGAASIIDATLSILAIIFFKLHLQKHPSATDELATAPHKKGVSPWVALLIIYLAVQFAVPMLISIGLRF